MTSGITAGELYEDLWGRPRPGFDARIEASLNPSAPALLYERFLELGLSAEDVVLDVGCRDAGYAVRFARDSGCRVYALDPVPCHRERALKTIQDAGLGERVTFLPAPAEAIPLEAGSVDHIWCRDVFGHLDHRAALGECFRVLRPGGTMLTYQCFGTEWMEPREAAHLYSALAIRPENMARTYFEEQARKAGFRIVETRVIGVEWRERGIEDGTYSLDPLLLRLCRMRRLEAELVQEYGRPFYEAAYAGELWLVYIALGKLCPVIHELGSRG